MQRSRSAPRSTKRTCWSDCMEREEAFELITSVRASDRLRAAVALVTAAAAGDLSKLLQLRAREEDAYVLARLRAAIEACSSKQQPEPSVIKPDLIDAEYIQRQAIEEVAGTLLHEIGSKLGLVALCCSQEIPDFTNSRTATHVRNLQSIFDAIGQLRSAANPSGYESFDLASLISEIIEVEAHDRTNDIALHGPRPMIVHSSCHLVRLAFCNGIRNSIEALIPAPVDSADYPVVVNWGSSDVEYWVSIIDNGPGVASISQRIIFAMGGTTKKQHLGFGLAIAKQAMSTLGGSVILENSPGGGARFEMRWGKAQ